MSRHLGVRDIFQEGWPQFFVYTILSGNVDTEEGREEIKETAHGFMSMSGALGIAPDVVLSAMIYILAMMMTDTLHSISLDMLSD